MGARYKIRQMNLSDYDAVHALWLSCKGMGPNNLALRDMVRIDT